MEKIFEKFTRQPKKDLKKNPTKNMEKQHIQLRKLTQITEVNGGTPDELIGVVLIISLTNRWSERLYGDSLT